MDTIVAKIGYYSALCIAFAFLLFSVCFVIIAVTQPYQAYVDLPSYVAYMDSHSPLYKYIAQGIVVGFCPLFLVLLHCLRHFTPESLAFWPRLSISMGTIFACLVGLNYFVQLTGFRFSAHAGDLEGLQHFFMFNPHSPFLSIAMLGWTLFFGLSSLCIAPIFRHQGLSKTLRWIFFINGGNCLVGGLAYIFEWVFLVNLTMNFILGGTLLAIGFGLMAYFKKKLATPIESPTDL